MQNTAQKSKRLINILRKLLTFLSFIIPFIILYSLDPKSFEATWKGRTYFLFFLWLFFLEGLLSFKELQPKECKLKSWRNIAFIIVSMLPTIYVIAANYYGLNDIIVDLAVQNQIPWSNWMPLSTEYLVMTALLALMIVLGYGITGLKEFSLSTIFLGTIGAIYTIDNLYPYGRFTPFQILVPITTLLAANVLSLIGYKTIMSVITHPHYGYMSYLTAWDPNNPLKSASFGVAWPCSGVESILIYTLTILLFLKKTSISLIHRIIYFIIGALVTYLINILRIVTIFVISINGQDIGTFHSFYAQLISITWIMSYPLIIIGSRALWREIVSRKS